MRSLLRGIRVDVIVLIMVAMGLGAFGQVAMKMGMQNIGQVSVTDLLGEKFVQVATEKFVVVGVILYILSLGVWLTVLSKAELSFAYPLIGLSYVVVAILSGVFFHENLTMFRIFGIALIVSGVFFVVRFG